MGVFQPRDMGFVQAALNEHGNPYDEAFARENADLVANLAAQGQLDLVGLHGDHTRQAVIEGTKIAVAVLRQEGMLKDHPLPIGFFIRTIIRPIVKARL